MNTGFELDRQIIEPGERRYIDLSLPPLYTHTSVSMPVHVICGKRSGPRLFVTAAIHGDEINGVEIIRRLLSTRALSRLRGTLVAVPVVNVYGFVAQSRYLPDRRDLNRSFPGSERGSMAARLADLVKSEIIDKCTHGIDLHTAAAGRDNLPQVRYQFDGNAEATYMAHAFAPPIIVNSEPGDGTLRKACGGKPVILFEAGEALRFSEVAIKAGVSGILRVMRHLQMLPESRRSEAPGKHLSNANNPRSGKTTEKIHKALVSTDSTWVRASQSGILRARVSLGDPVSEGQSLGVVADPIGELEEEVYSEAAGVIIGQSNLPLVHEGEAVFHVAKIVTG